jgi:hypothetical protein
MNKVAERYEELFNKIMWGEPSQEERVEYEDLVEEIHRKFVEKFGSEIRMK